MKPVLIILFFSLVLIRCTSNTEAIKDSNAEKFPLPVFNPNNYDEIGFACGAAGEGSMLVKEVTSMIVDKNYKRLKESLYSSEPGMIYLATFSCEKLAQEGMIKLNEVELKQIEKNQNRMDTISVCSGCMTSEYFTVKQLLRDTNNYMKNEAEFWFDEILGKNIIED